MASIFINPFVDVGSGVKPADGSQLFFFATDAVTPKDTFTTSVADVAHTNPVIANASGVFDEIWIEGSYVAVLKDKNDVQQWQSQVFVSTLSGVELESELSERVISQPTLAVAVADTGLSAGETLNIKERTAGNGGGGIWDVVLTSTVTPNTYNIVQSTGDVTLSLALRVQVNGQVLAKQWGYIADGSTAGQEVVLQFIIDEHTSLLNDSGVTINLGIGTGILSAELLISLPNVRFIGTGKRNVYLAESAVSQPIRASATSPTTLIGVHTDRNLIRFFNDSITNEAGTFTANGVNFGTLETGSVPTAAFGFDASGKFHRDYLIDGCGVFGFTSAFDMYKGSGTSNVAQFAALKVINSNINRNGWIARNLDTTQWNGFIFQRNEAGQNSVGGTGVFDLRGQDIVINDGNILEGQDDTIKVSGNFQGTIIEGNYFEANAGDFVIFLSQTLNSRVGPNFYGSVTAVDPVKLFSCPSPTVDEGVNVFYDGCTNVKDMNNVIGLPQLSADVNGGSILMPFSKVARHGKRIGGKTPEFFTVVAPEEAMHNIPDSAGAIHDTTGDGDFTTRNATTTAYTSGDILVAVSVVSYNDEPVIAPRLRVDINTGGADGQSPGIFNNFNKGIPSFKNRTFVMFSFAKATATGNSTVAGVLYPFGLGAATGLTCSFTTWIWNMGQDFTSLEPFVCPEMYERASAAPLVGTWNAGDTLKLTKGLGVAGGTDGFFCTIAGTPGTWKTGGAIGP